MAASRHVSQRMTGRRCSPDLSLEALPCRPLHTFGRSYSVPPCPEPHAEPRAERTSGWTRLGPVLWSPTAATFPQPSPLPAPILWFPGASLHLFLVSLNVTCLRQTIGFLR